jgi:PAS domain S-box-containing protein
MNQALRDSERRAQALLDAMSDMMYRFHKDGTIIDFKAAPEHLLIEPDQVIGTNIMDTPVPEDVRQAVLDAVVKSIETGQAQEFECRLEMPGGLRIYENRYVKIGDDEAVGIVRDVTEHRLAEETLRESKERLRLALSAADMGTWSWNPAANQDMRDATLNRMLGLDAGDSIQPVEDFLQRVHPEDRTRVSDEVQRAISENGKYACEFRIVRPDETIRWLRDQGKVYFDEQGTVSHITGTVIDITERRQIEEALKTQQYYLEKAQEIGCIGTWELGLCENVLKWTDENYRIFGVPVGTALTYEVFLNCVHPDDRDYVHERWDAALNHEPYDSEHRLIVDGKVKWVREKAELEYDEQGNATKAIGFTQDITKRKQTEEDLQRECRMRKTLLDNIPSCLAMIVKKGTREIVASNTAAQEIGAVAGVTCYSTCSQRDDPCPWCLGPECWATDQYRRLEIEYRSSHYEGIWLPLTEDLYVHYIFDITERKRAEQQIIENQAQLKSLASELVLAEEQERKRLAVHLHDNVCQNLAYAKMKLQMLSAALEDQTQLDDMTEVSDTLTRMMQEVRMLTFELSTPVLSEFGLEAAISHWLDEQIQGKHAIMATFVDDGQSKPLEKDVQALLFRSVRELLANVVKHSQARHVEVNMCREEDQILIRLEDNGIGFAPGQVAVCKDTGGFGLFSIRQRLSQMGGSLEIDASPGQGCRSLLRAPLLQSQAKDEHHDN